MSARTASCTQPPGRFVPRIDFARCEGKADCVRVCPENVFEIGRLADRDYAALPWLARLKQRVHGRKVAHTPRAQACLACGLCVTACPEDAIRLERAAGA
jgi:NAD-dependent dihydropyrimidine dehydrogenase PreA subunit